jgi:hypothetical protein
MMDEREEVMREEERRNKGKVERAHCVLWFPS